MSNKLIPNFDKKIKTTKKQITILNNVRKCKLITDYLKLETKGTTTRNYGSFIRDYFVKLNIININNYIKDPRLIENNKEKIQYLDKIEKDIKIFNKEIQNKSGTNRKAQLSAIRNLLEFNKIELGNHFWKSTRKNGNKTGTQTDYKTLDKEQLKKVLSRADTEYKAFFLTQMTSASRIDSILKLDLNQLNLNTTPPEIRLYSEDEKNGKPITKFISTEAKEYLEKYLKIRKNILKERLKKVKYFIRNEKDYKKIEQEYNNRVFPNSYSNVERIWNDLLDKEQLYTLDPKTNKPIYGTHSLIRYFEDNIGKRELKLYLRNKLSKSEELYIYRTRKKLDNEYLEYEKNLHIFKDYGIDKLKEDYELKNYELDKTLEELKQIKDFLNIENIKTTDRATYLIGKDKLPHTIKYKPNIDTSNDEYIGYDEKDLKDIGWTEEEIKKYRQDLLKKDEERQIKNYEEWKEWKNTIEYNKWKKQNKNKSKK